MFVRLLLIVVLALGGRAVAASLASDAVLHCVEAVDGVAWDRWKDADPRLDDTCASVGRPVLRPPAYIAGADITSLRIVSWNIKVGGGRAETFIPQQIHEAGPNKGVVVLLQEAFRTGWDVPETYPRTLDVPHAIRPRRPIPDVVGLATQSELWVAYVPSMRNGPATSASKREDRGNAILSTEPLRDVVAIELPFGRQRRVAIAATIAPRGSHATPIRVVVLHFDRGRAHDAQAAALAARVRMLAADKTMPLIVAGDLNSANGVKDAAVAALSDVVHREDECGTGRTMRWPLRFDVFFLQRLDFMFSTLDPDRARTCTTLKDTFGSDHVPVVMDVKMEVEEVEEVEKVEKVEDVEEVEKVKEVEVSK
jgi:endonuclease/exonuclease/phosphatase family metal-dependent hydrolase